MRTDVEFLRVVAALGIVWFHSGYDFGRDVAYSGLVVFLILTSYFAINSKKNHSPLSRAVRFLIPCIVWSFFYAFITFARDQPIFPENYNSLSKVLSTPSIHLWYLPFAFISVIALDKLKKHNLQVIAVTATILAALLLLSSPFWRQWSTTPPLGQYLHALPALLLGVILASYSHLTKILKYILFTILLLSFASIVYFNVQGISHTYTIGALASLILIRKKSFLPQSNTIINLSKLTFGIYLIHPFYLFVLRHLEIGSFYLPIFAFLLSIISIYIILKVIPKSVSQYIA